MSRRVLEVTDAQRKREFIKQINGLIRNTGKFERDKVDRMIDLLNRARADLQQTILSAGPKNKFTRQTANELRRETERLMAEFQARAELQMNAAQQGISDIASDTIDAIAKSQGRRSSLLGIKPELVEIAQGRSASLIKSLARRNIGRVSDIVNRGVLTGKSIFEVGKELSTEFGKSLAQMETIARTEMLGIHGATTFAEIQAMAETSPGLQKQWISVIDERTRLGHKTPTDAGGAHLQTVPVEDFFLIPQTIRTKTGFSLGPVDSMLYPRDPNGTAGNIINCFPAGTMVQGTFVGGTRAFYSGRMIRIRTKQGLRVSVTPNHPILTSSGFLKAGMLHKGTNIVRNSASIKTSPVCVDEENPEAPIEEIFSSLSIAGRHRQVCGRYDFHGDGLRINGEIDIVGPAGKLLADLEPSPSECELILEGSLVSSSSETSPCPGLLNRRRIFLASPSLPGTRALIDYSCSPKTFYPSPFHQLRIGSASRINASRYKVPPEGGTRDTFFLADLFKRFSSLISFDEVLEIGNYKFSGHVYDLQSPFGWLFANSLAFSNCRCTLIPDFSNVDPPGLSLVEMPPIEIPLSDLTGEVEKSVRKGFRNLR